MSISRRRFLKYGAVTVAGMAVPGLVAAGLEETDVAGLPNIPLEGDESWAESICRLCPAGCGIKVRQIGDYPVSVMGNTADPISRGGICPRGAAIIQELYHPDRLKKPLMRKGDRGAGRWREVSWEEAIQGVAGKLSGIQGTPESLAVISGVSGDLTEFLLRRFMRAFGSPNYLEFGVSYSQLPVDAFSAMHGEHLGVGYDLAGAGYLISFGADWLQTFSSPVEASRSYARLRRSREDVRVRVVQVEPRLSITAGKADEWIPIRPGTYGALALGMAYVMIDEGLIDSEFIKKQSFGFEDWTDGAGEHHRGFRTTVVNDYSPKAVSEITGVPADVIRRLGREFGKSDRPLAIGSRYRLFDQMAVHSLNALAGSIQVPGGTVQGRGNLLKVLLEERAQQSAGRVPVDDGINHRLGHSAPSRLPHALTKDQPYDLTVLMLVRSNPAFVGPDANKWIQALRRIPFIVSLTSFIDDTAEYADVILPTHSTLESRMGWGNWTTDGVSVVKHVDPVIKPLYGTREYGDIILQLARVINGKLLAALPWSTWAEYLKHITNAVALSEDRSEGIIPAFKTATGKFEFCSLSLGKALAASGDQTDCSPHYEPVEYLGDRENYPLHLYVYSPLSLLGGDGAHLPFMPGIAGSYVQDGWGTWVEINPETAKHLEVADGRDVWIESPFGKIRARARVYAGAMPDVVSMPLGFGHTSYGRWAKDMGSNPSSIVGSALDYYTGQSIWHSTRVRITKAA